MVSIRTVKICTRIPVFIFLISFIIYCTLIDLLYSAFKGNEIYCSKSKLSSSSNFNRYRNTERPKAVTKDKFKYILVWTNVYPFHHLQEKQASFTDNNCPHTNCYVTTDRNYLKDMSNFHAILFSSVSCTSTQVIELPKKRSSRQKYVFASMETSVHYPLVHPNYDNYFNWTWTFRPSSDISWNYFTVYDKNGRKVGPEADMKWPKIFKPIDEHLKERLKRKTKAAAFIVSHCITFGRRENFVVKLKEALKPYNLTVDVFGGCGNVSCSIRECPKMLRRHYYFYLSFENTLEEGYVTEKLVTGLNNFAVPIVYGGANYSWYAPPGSYLNARELGPKKLAATMNTLINNLTLYYEYFSWTNHLVYKLSYASTELCNICTAVNNKRMMKTITTYKDLRIWWNGRIKLRLYELLLKHYYNYSLETIRELMMGLINEP